MEEEDVLQKLRKKFNGYYQIRMRFTQLQKFKKVSE